MKRLYILTLCSLILAIFIFLFKKRIETTIPAGEGLVVPKKWLVTNRKPFTPVKDIRPADQTFLTYPEWYLVFSPEEQAAYFKNHTATTFPFMAHTAQIWNSYDVINKQIKDIFPTNTGYHFMIWVIGSSASVEYSIKALYETLVGRITDTQTPVTAEDQFNALFTKDYVDFIKDKPWYEFDFKNRLKTLWTTSLWDDNLLRKWDRKYILTSELSVKYVYGKLIGLGTKEVYDEALPTTAVVLSNDSLVYLPRYDKFNAAVTGLANQGYKLKEVAGNNSAIVLSAIVAADKPLQLANTQLLFTQPVASDLTKERVVIAMPVSNLTQILLQLHKKDVQIEHVFDY